MQQEAEKTLEELLAEITARHSLTPLEPPSDWDKEQEEKELAKRRKKIKSLIPPKYWDLETDRVETVDPLINKSLFLSGGAGAGKTVFACSVAKATIMAGKEVKFLSYPLFIMQMQNSYRNDAEDPLRLALDVARFKGLVVLDDLGAEKLTDYVRQMTYLLLNEREQWQLPIIITSNFSISELDVQVDSRVSSRIAGMCEVIKLSGSDRRLKK